MPVGERVSDHVLNGRRHGVFVRRGVGDVAWRHGTRTRRGATRRYLEAVEWLPVDPDRAEARPGDELVLVKVEGLRIVAEQSICVPPTRGGDDPDGGVREPRGPQPSPRSGTAVADPPEN